VNYNEISSTVGGIEIWQSLRVYGGIRTDAFVSAVMQNGWIAYGTEYYSAQYMKDPMGFVHIRGSIKNGTSGAVAFTLPAGYRPSKIIRGTLLGDWTNA